MRLLSGHGRVAMLVVVACAFAAAGQVAGASSQTVTAGVVTIDKIALEQSVGPEVVLSSTPTTTDLLTLASTAPVLSGVAVPPGTYSELRFYVDGGYIQVQNGDGTTSIYATSPDYSGLPPGVHVTGTLQQPMALKVLPANMVIATSVDSKLLLTDFDVSQSFGHQAGGSDSWVMHPVIQGADLTLSGNVGASATLGTGVTLPVLDGTQVTLADFSAVLTTSTGSPKTLPLADLGSGSFGTTFQYLLPGTYTLTLQPPPGMSFTTTPASPETITVSSGQDTQLDFTITAASAP